jgi:hypothetical protein
MLHELVCGCERQLASRLSCICCPGYENACANTVTVSARAVGADVCYAVLVEPAYWV